MMRQRSSLREQVRELTRELSMRRRVYPHLVQRGTLTEAQAQYQMDVLLDAMETLRALADAPRGQGELFPQRAEQERG